MPGRGRGSRKATEAEADGLLKTAVREKAEEGMNKVQSAPSMGRDSRVPATMKVIYEMQLCQWVNMKRQG